MIGLIRRRMIGLIRAFGIGMRGVRIRGVREQREVVGMRRMVEVWGDGVVFVVGLSSTWERRWAMAC